MTEPSNAASARNQALVAAALARPNAPFRTAPERWLLVDVARQRLMLMNGATPIDAFPISTALNGIGSALGSHRTPPGWHRVHEAIGAGAEPGTRFVSRAPTGEVWRGEASDEDLILTRVLTLDGLEEGVNRGPGHDSLERYIYIHGTHDEADIGRPLSHGCVRMTNADIVRVFDAVSVGTPVAIIGDLAGEDYAAAARRVDSDTSLEAARRTATPAGAQWAALAAATPLPRASDSAHEPHRPSAPRSSHYVGLGGSGMSALAQFEAMTGGRVTGSDRAFDRGERAAARAQLEALGVRIAPQDGRGVTAALDAVVISTAVETQVPDVIAAHAAGVPIVHRSERLAEYVDSHRTLAIAGTSGKSTVVAMVFEILRAVARDPSVITGGDLITLQREGRWGNAWAGRSELLVAEADESDGSLVRYEPAIAVVLNLQKDHKEMAEVAALFSQFVSRAREGVVLGDDPALAPLARLARERGLALRTFGTAAGAGVRASAITLDPGSSRFMVGDVTFTLPAPGRHNVDNALAAIATCSLIGVPIAAMAAPLAGFEGVGRRFQSLGSARGVEVVDDFAHNPAKLRAALATAQRRAARVLAVFQAHGFGPTRFLRPDLVAAFAESLRPADRVWLLEIFFAGGTAVQDLSAADLVADIVARGTSAEFAPSREWLVDRIAAEARAGDLVLVMGARDPSLTDLGRDILKRLDTTEVRS